MRATFLPIALRVGAPLLARVELEDVAEVCAAFCVGLPIALASAQAGDQVDRLASAESGPEADVARNVGDAAMQRDGIRPRVQPEDGRRSSRAAHQPEQDAERGGLAGPVGAEEAVDLAGRDAEVEAVECSDPAEGLAEAGDVDDGVHERDVTPVSQFL